MIWLSLFLLFLALVWMIGSWVAHRRAVGHAAAAAKWPAASGEILVSGVDAITHKDPESGTVSYTYFPALHYRYGVAGSMYEGTRLRFGTVRTGNRTRADGWLAPYPVGARPQVRYNPDDPADSVLDPTKPPAGPYMVAGLAVGFVLAFLGLWAYSAS